MQACTLLLGLLLFLGLATDRFFPRCIFAGVCFAIGRHQDIRRELHRFASSPPGESIRHGTMIVLGAGGHSAEMTKLLLGVGCMKEPKFGTRVFVVDKTDEACIAAKLRENQLTDDHSIIVPIARARSVGQSWFSSCFTTLYAMVDALCILWKYRPLRIFCNGPGTCLPVCAVAYLLKFFGIHWSNVTFVESVSRVHALSLTGRLLYHFGLVTQFLVQTSKLQILYQEAITIDEYASL